MPLRGAIAAAILVPFLGASTAFAAEGVGHAEKFTPSKGAEVASIGYLSPREREAMSFRRLQTELMVAALSCGRHDFRSKYNTFVVRFRPALRSNGRTLKAIFKRTYGHRGTRRLDAYVTKLANEASVRSMENAAFCETAGRKFDAVLRARSTETARGLLRQTQNP
jgi:hypothetical protein